MTRRCLPTNRCISVSLTNQATALASQPGLTICSSSLQVTCMGHIIGAVLADTQLHAQRATKAVKIQYEELQPIVTIQVRPVTSDSSLVAVFRCGKTGKSVCLKSAIN